MRDYESRSRNAGQGSRIIPERLWPVRVPARLFDPAG